MLDAGDANTCAAAAANDYCGSNATSFYETFNYTDTDGLYGDAGTVWRVMITSGAPDHSAESTLLIPAPTGHFNPNVRCKISPTDNIFLLYHYILTTETCTAYIWIFDIFMQ